MREQVARLTKLTADLLDLSKLDADAMEINAERGRPERDRETGRGASSGRQPSGTVRAIEVNGDRAAVAMADADRVAQIMRILLDNALTHTPEGTSISIDSQRQDGTASLVVSDDGPGIDPHAARAGLRPLLHGRSGERLRAGPGDRPRARRADGRRAGARVAAAGTRSSRCACRRRGPRERRLEPARAAAARRAAAAAALALGGLRRGRLRRPDR